MAKTHRDIDLALRIKSLSEQLTGAGKSSNEIIEMIAGVCAISLRTASEHYRAWKAQKTLNEIGFVETCSHQWSVPFTTPGGLVKECRVCHTTEEVNL